MGETIRDVTIRVKIQQMDFSLRVPNTEAIQSSMEKTGTTVKSMSTNVESAFAKVNAASVAANTQAASIGETAVKSTKIQGREAEKEATILDKKAKANAKIAEDVAKYKEAAVKGNIEAADKLKASAEGVFVLARGIAFLSSSSEADFEKVLRKIAAIQGAFDVFKGSIDTIKNLNEATRALRQASEAAAAGQAVLTASTVAGTAATTASTAATAASLTVLGPVGLAVIGVTAAITAGAVAWKYYSNEAKKAKEAEEILTKQRIAATQLKGELESLADSFAASMSKLQSGSDSGLTLLAEKSKVTRKETTVQEVEDVRLGSRDRLKAVLESQDNKKLKKSAEQYTGIKDDTVIGSDEDISDTVGMIRESTKNENSGLKSGDSGGGALEATQKQQRIMSAIVEQQKQGSDLERQKLDILTKQGDELRKNLETTKDAIKENKKAVEDEQKRLMSAEARFGALDTAQQEQLKQIASKASSGEKLSKEESVTLQQSGFGEEIATKNLSRIGQEAGSGQVLKQLGETQNLSKLKEQGSKLEGEVSKLVEAIEKKSEEEKEQLDRVVKGLETLTDYSQLLEAVERIIDRKNAKGR